MKIDTIVIFWLTLFYLIFEKLEHVLEIEYIKNVKFCFGILKLKIKTEELQRWAR